jgi:hypothetical protein
MSVRELGALVSAGLGNRLKPYGSSRRGARLSRNQERYVEHYAISGNRWQSGVLSLISAGFQARCAFDVVIVPL